MTRTKAPTEFEWLDNRLENIEGEVGAVKKIVTDHSMRLKEIEERQAYKNGLEAGLQKGKESAAKDFSLKIKTWHIIVVIITLLSGAIYTWVSGLKI